jgi:phosphoglycerate dehydrogenase-like enzyme/predicted dehydrogenase
VIRALVIGAGPATVQMHLPVLATLRDRGQIELRLICDINRERAVAARRNFGFLEDCAEGLSALERHDIDVAYIFGSAHLHHEYGMVALRNGKHLFVEKPIAPTYVDALSMAQQAQARGLMAVGGHNRRFYKSLAAVRANAGNAGWQFAEATFHKAEYAHAPSYGARTWLGANGIHALDALVFMMGGLPEQLAALAGKKDAAQQGTFSAIMRWRDGGQGAFLCNNNAGARRETYVFHSPGETYEVSDTGLTIEKGNTVVKAALPAIGDGIAAEHESFLNAICTGIAPPHSLASIVPSLFLAELIESGFSGRVSLPEREVPVTRAMPEPGLSAISILVTHSDGLHLPLARLLPRYRLVSLQEVQGSTAERPDILAAILGRGSEPLAADVLSRLPRLSVVGVQGLSLSRHDPDSLAARGISLVNSSAAYAESVAEFALGLAILSRRRAFSSHELMRHGRWGTAMTGSGPCESIRHYAGRLRPALKTLGLESFLLRAWKAIRLLSRPPGSLVGQSRDLANATVGLVGWGANARAFSRRLAAASARVLVYSEHATNADIAIAGASRAPLSEVLAADIVSLHRGLTSTTRHCLGETELARLRPGAILINVARGALIEPNALLKRLRRRDIFACLDTFEDEPLDPSHPLRSLPNVFLTSHIAGSSRDMHAAAAEEVVRKVAAFLHGETTEAISAERLRTMS